MQAPAENNMIAILAQVRQKFQSSLPERLERLDGLVAALELADDPKIYLREIMTEAHRLRGVARTVGFNEIDAHAAKVEYEIDGYLRGASPVLSVSELMTTTEMLLEAMDAASGN